MQLGVSLFPCELDDHCSILAAIKNLKNNSNDWDTIICCPGTQKPIGAFVDVNFTDWQKSFSSNFFGQLEIVHSLMTSRSDKTRAKTVIFFAGGGSNGAPLNYSAYITAKIAMTKLVELLDAENMDVAFTIIGPGWVNTKIHKATLETNEKFAGASLKKTIEMLSGKNCTSMETVISCVDWVLNSPKKIIGGRNFSVAHDNWGSEELEKALVSSDDMYKLRRAGNDWNG